jgi:hypothetical protein
MNMKTSMKTVRSSKTIGWLLLLAMVGGTANVGCTFSAKNPSGGGIGGNIGTGLTGGNSGTGGTTNIPGLTALTINPPSASLAVSSINGLSSPAQMQQYKVTGTVNGQQQDLTGQVSYSTNPTGVVTVNSSGLAVTTGTSGGVVTVTATSGGLSATATLTVNYEQRHLN